MKLLPKLEGFFRDHCSQGSLTADATEPAWNGYLLTVTYPCGVVFGRWVTPRGCLFGSDFLGEARSEQKLVDAPDRTRVGSSDLRLTRRFRVRL